MSAEHTPLEDAETWVFEYIRQLEGALAMMPMDVNVSGAVSTLNKARTAYLMVKHYGSLLALARQYASECAECDGEGTFDAELGFEEACEACADIRKIIAKAVKP